MFVKILLAKEIESYIYGLEPSDHVILFYDTLEGKRNILYRFLADGLGKKKGFVHICSDESPDQVRSGLESYGVDVGGERGGWETFNPELRRVVHRDGSGRVHQDNHALE